jgi:hypothetical protein
MSPQPCTCSLAPIPDCPQSPPSTPLNQQSQTPGRVVANRLAVQFTQQTAMASPGPRLCNIQFESAGDSDSDSDEHPVRQVRRSTRSAVPMAHGLVVTLNSTRSAVPMAHGPVVTLNSDDEELNETPPAPQPSRRGRGTGSAAPTLQPHSTHSNQNVIHSADKWHGHISSSPAWILLPNIITGLVTRMPISSRCISAAVFFWEFS